MTSRTKKGCEAGASLPKDKVLCADAGNEKESWEQGLNKYLVLLN